MQNTLIAGVGVQIPIVKLRKFVKEVIVTEGPASANISAILSRKGRSESVLPQE